MHLIRSLSLSLSPHTDKLSLNVSLSFSHSLTHSLLVSLYHFLFLSDDLYVR